MTRFVNAEDSRMTDWALTHVSVGNGANILDVGCGGGRTVQKLAGMTAGGKVFGIDLSEEIVAIPDLLGVRDDKNDKRPPTIACYLELPSHKMGSPPVVDRRSREGVSFLRSVGGLGRARA
jgi:SAM-dependent methyltransferase